MRWTLLVCGVVLGCGCSGTSANEEAVAGELCFQSPHPLLVETYPDFAERAEEAADSWGWGLRWDDSCPSWFGVLNGVGDEAGPVAQTTHCRGPADDCQPGPSAAFVGGQSQIAIRRERIGNGLLDVEDLAACESDFRAARDRGETQRMQVLSYVLRHELGHVVLESDWHSSDEASLMHHRIWDCYDALPGPEELRRALSPARGR